MTIWAGTPYLLRDLMQGLYMFITRQPIYNQGLAGLVLDSAPKLMAVEGVPIMPQLPATGQLVAAALLGRVDIYLIWHIWLLVLGLVAFVKLSRKKALLITLGIWLIFTLPTLLPALLGLGQGGMAF